MSEETKTTVEEVSMEDIENLLAAPGTEATMTEEEKEEAKKPKFFQKGEVDLSFIEETSTEEGEEGDDEEEKTTTEEDDFSKVVVNAEEEEAEEDKSKGGREKLDKKGMAQLIDTLIKEDILLPFEDEEKPLEDYTMEEFKELISLNFQEQKRKVEETTPQEFFESLPEELQYAAKYVATGGTDLKGLFKVLAESQEAKELDLSTEQGQERTIREYYRAINFGTEEEIQDEIDGLKDLEKLEEKAQQFQPKLNAMRDKIVQKKIQEQELNKEKQRESARKYAENIHGLLSKGDLNGLKMTPKVQNLLYQGLTQANYPSVNGRATNMFGHLIEKHQFVEPNHSLIAEALWLLADPDGYKNEIKKGAKNETAAETARKLKTEQASKVGGGGTADADTGKKTTVKGIPKPTKNFFQRS